MTPHGRLGFEVDRDLHPLPQLAPGVLAQALDGLTYRVNGHGYAIRAHERTYARSAVDFDIIAQGNSAPLFYGHFSVSGTPSAYEYNLGCIEPARHGAGDPPVLQGIASPIISFNRLSTFI